VTAGAAADIAKMAKGTMRYKEKDTDLKDTDLLEVILFSKSGCSRPTTVSADADERTTVFRRYFGS
jgi:hypothetical protein